MEVRTNVVLNEKLVKKSMKATGITTKRALLDYALRELLRHEGQARVLEFEGKIDWEGDLKKSRESREF